MKQKESANVEPDVTSLLHSKSQLISPDDPLRRQANHSETKVLLSTNPKGKCIPFLSENSVSNSAYCRLHQLLADLPIHSFPHFSQLAGGAAAPPLPLGGWTLCSFPQLFHSSPQSFCLLSFHHQRMRFRCSCLPAMLISHSLIRSVSQMDRRRQRRKT